MKAGISSYGFRYAIGAASPTSEERMTFKWLLEYCNEKKIEVIQICDNLSLHQMPDEQLQDCLSLSVKYGIDVEVGTVGFFFNHLNRYLEISRYFQSKVLRTVLNAGKNQGKGEIIQNIRQLIPILELNNIALAIENHFDLTPLELLGLIEEVNHPLVKICIDPLNSISLLWGMHETLAHLQQHIVSAHVKDVKVERNGTGFLITGCPLGEGIAGIETYIRMIYRANPKCNVFLEQWMDPQETLVKTLDEEQRWVNDGVIYLKRIISNL